MGLSDLGKYEKVVYWKTKEVILSMVLACGD